MANCIVALDSLELLTLEVIVDIVVVSVYPSRISATFDGMKLHGLPD